MGKIKLLELFNKTSLNPQLKWHCEPSVWKIHDNQLHISPDANTDFWQKTHYGFKADNGHFLYTGWSGDFILETQVSCDFKNQYDQAGLMVYVSDQCWMKTSVEYEPDKPNKLGVVVTNYGYSDWSTQDVDKSFTDFKIRILRDGSTWLVQYYHSESSDWVQLRMFHLFDEPEVKAGLYACSPKAAPFTARFHYLNIEGKP